MAKISNWTKSSKIEWVRLDGCSVSRTENSGWQANVLGDDEDRPITVKEVTGKDGGDSAVHVFSTAQAAIAWLEAFLPLSSGATSTAPMAEPAREIPDLLGKFLVEKGFVPNQYILDLNHGLSTPPGMDLPYPWSLPSRLFEFPIEVSALYEDGSRKIGIIHPLLKDHPFVQIVARDLESAGFVLGLDGGPEPSGHRKGELGPWWHAIDLVMDGLVEDLVATRQFTTDDCICRAVAAQLLEGELKVKAAREILARLGVEEPADRLAVFFAFPAPSKMSGEGGGSAPYRPINHPPGVGGGEKAWAVIAAIEAGFFERKRDGRYVWSDLGEVRHRAGSSDVVVETSGQAAFCF